MGGMKGKWVVKEKNLKKKRLKKKETKKAKGNALL